MSNAKISAKANKAQTALVENLKIRLALVEEQSGKTCATLRTDLQTFESANGAAIIDACMKKGLEINDFIEIVKHNENKFRDGFLAVKAITKCRQFMTAVAQGNSRLLDGYTDSIMKNLLKHKTLTVFECLQCLSTKVINDGTDTMRIDENKKITAYKNSGASTATTQSSSSRMMLQMFKVCDTVKGQKDASLTFTDAKNAQLMLDLYKLDADIDNAA